MTGRTGTTRTVKTIRTAQTTGTFRAAVLFTGLILFVAMTGMATAAQPEALPPQPQALSEQPVQEPEVVAEDYSFSNSAEGYRLTLPGELVQDPGSSSSRRTVFLGPTLRLEVYRQPTGEISSATYMNYSNGFLKNTVDHTKEWKGTAAIAGSKARILQWSREKLLRVERDLNYYACVDIPAGSRGVYTLLFKSTQPFADREEYMAIARSFKLIDRQKAAQSAPAPSEESAPEPSASQGNPVGSSEATISLPVQPPVQVLPAWASIAHRSWNEKTLTAFERYFGEQSTLSWGIFEPGAPEYLSRLNLLEERVDYTFPLLVYYQHFTEDGNNSLLGQALANVKEKGRIPELTLQTVPKEDGSNMLYDVLNGEYDAYLDGFIREIQTADIPVIMRFCNEMNGDWCPYSGYLTSRDPEIYKEAYKYVYEKFRQKGALENTIWVWNPNEKSFPDFVWNDESMYYPGDAYVDIIGLTGYNTGTYYKGEAWRSFQEIYDPVYERALAEYPHKPMMITEFASSSVGGDKEAWVADMFAQIGKYEHLKAAVWWSGWDWDADGTVARPYWMDETQALVDLFRQNLAPYKPAPPIPVVVSTKTTVE